MIQDIYMQDIYGNFQSKNLYVVIVELKTIIFPAWGQLNNLQTTWASLHEIKN
jgi:hypothetical protein